MSIVLRLLSKEVLLLGFCSSSMPTVPNYHGDLIKASCMSRCAQLLRRVLCSVAVGLSRAGVLVPML
jgi:hypothetical protein